MPKFKGPLAREEDEYEDSSNSSRSVGLMSRYLSQQEPQRAQSEVYPIEPVRYSAFNPTARPADVGQEAGLKYEKRTQIQRPAGQSMYLSQLRSQYNQENLDRTRSLVSGSERSDTVQKIGTREVVDALLSDADYGNLYAKVDFFKGQEPQLFHVLCGAVAWYGQHLYEEFQTRYPERQVARFITRNSEIIVQELCRRPPMGRVAFYDTPKEVTLMSVSAEKELWLSSLLVNAAADIRKLPQRPGTDTSISIGDTQDFESFPDKNGFLKFLDVDRIRAALLQSTAFTELKDSIRAWKRPLHPGIAQFAGLEENIILRNINLAPVKNTGKLTKDVDIRTGASIEGTPENLPGTTEGDPSGEITSTQQPSPPAPQAYEPHPSMTRPGNACNEYDQTLPMKRREMSLDKTQTAGASRMSASVTDAELPRDKPSQLQQAPSSANCLKAGYLGPLMEANSVIRRRDRRSRSVGSWFDEREEISKTSRRGRRRRVSPSGSRGRNRSRSTASSLSTRRLMEMDERKQRTASLANIAASSVYSPKIVDRKEHSTLMTSEGISPSSVSSEPACDTAPAAEIVQQQRDQVELWRQDIRWYIRESTLKDFADRHHLNIWSLVSGVLGHWGVAFTFDNLAEMLLPRLSPGYRRYRWRCSCNTMLWANYPAEEHEAWEHLKRDLQSSSAAFAPNSYSKNASVHMQSQTAATRQYHPNDSLSSTLGKSNSPEDTDNGQVGATSSSMLPHVVDINLAPRYFEVCVNLGNHAICHHEIDISSVTTDSELFRLIWQRYNDTRGKGLRALFLQPKDVHFVIFSVSRVRQYGAGIHKKPDEFPPKEELDAHRYHYLCPKISMPVNWFLHYLHRGRWDTWGEHTEDISLKRLPKKLKQGLLEDIKEGKVEAPVGAQDGDADQNLAFGWGVHILDGPNHAGIAMLLSIGILISLLISGFVVGFARTLEGGFGVGNFLL